MATVAQQAGQSAQASGTGPTIAASRNPKSWEIMTALAGLGYSFRLNLLLDAVECNGQMLSPIVADEIHMRMRDAGYRYKEAIRECYTVQASRNSYHPVKEYLTGLTWDGQDHIRELADKLACSHPLIWHEGQQVSLSYLYLLKWLVGAVAKAHNDGPGAPAQPAVLVLDGAQGVGKSRFVRWLAPLRELYIESDIQPDKTDHLKFLAGRWVWEISELGATTRRQDVEKLNSFLALSTVSFIEKYERYPTVKRALASFIATVNGQLGFLNDPTGSRRFHVLPLDRIDWSYEAMDVHQVWAQAHAIYQQDIQYGGESWTLSDAQRRIRDAVNDNYHLSDAVDDWITYYFEIDPARIDWWISVKVIGDLLINAGYKGEINALTSRIGRTLTRRGLKALRKNKAGNVDPKGDRGYLGIKWK